jgi:teichuronic acid biosynthesis glycosyltransferase TuaG
MINQRREDPVLIVMPVYNAEPHIARTIESVQAQTHQNWRLVVVDDCSSDKTPEILESFAANDERLVILRLQENYGAPSRPRNTGIDHGWGEWIAFLDADDIWHPCKLEHQLEALAESKRLFCSTAMRNFQDDGDVDFGHNSAGRYHFIRYHQLVRKNQIPTSSVLLHHSLLGEQRFNEAMRYKAVEDYDLWLRLHRNIEASVKLDDVYVFYRISDAQISKGKLKMARRVFMIQRESCRKSIPMAALNTAIYAFLGVYLRVLRKGL